jgi:hypothetical protein
MTGDEVQHIEFFTIAKRIQQLLWIAICQAGMTGDKQ